MPSATVVLGPTAMSVTGLTETEIGTAGVGITVPAGYNCLRGVKTDLTIGLVPDALDHVPIFRLYSQDVQIEPCQFLGEVVSGVTTSGNGGKWTTTYWPLNVPVKGSNVIRAFCQLAVTVTPTDYATVTFYFSTDGPRAWASPLGTSQIHYRMPSTLTPVATVVTANTANISANPITLTTAKYVTAIYGAVWQTTHAVSVACKGKFKLTSPDWQIPFSPEFCNEGGDPFLSAGWPQNKLTKIGHDVIDDPDFYIPVNNQVANLTPVFTNGPLNIVGAYLMGVQYI